MKTSVEPIVSIVDASSLPEMHLVRKALGIRPFEQRLLKWFSEGRLFGTVHACIRQHGRNLPHWMAIVE